MSGIATIGLVLGTIAIHGSNLAFSEISHDKQTDASAIRSIVVISTLL
jgi:hypothetical protein